MNRLLGRMGYAAATLALGEQSVFRHLRDARRIHMMKADELMQREDRALHSVLDAARERVPYYAGIIPPRSGVLTARARLSRIPLLEKTTLQRHPADLRVPGYSGRLIAKSTGGSTGAPVRIVKDAEGVAREMATSWAALERHGIRVGDRSVRFWGTPLTAVRRARFRLTDLAMNRIRLSAFDLEEHDLERYWNRCRAFGPRWFYGYASLIHLFAEWIAKSGRDGTSLNLVAIVPTSEPLNGDQRRLISEVFNAPIVDEYGCGEVGAIAYGCDEGRLHVMTENVSLEILGADGVPVGSGEVGEVVVTDLTNFAMPLIRYRLGDRAEQGDACGCGLGFPTIARVMGRIHDVVFTPAGRRWHGEKVDYLMSQLFGEVGGFSQYQVIQREADLLEVRLVADDEIPEELKTRIARYVRDRLDGMRVEVFRVERIERAASGKLRLVRNDWMPQSAQPHA
jgi:phenylacetate-CoA ligase